MPEIDHYSTRPETVIGPIGRRRFIQGVGAAAGMAAISSVLPEGVAKAVPAGASQFIPLPVAVRVVDTREPGKYVFVRHWDNHISVPIAGSYGVPAEASAIVATVTSVNLSGGNWLTVVPSGADIIALLNQNRLVSALNMADPGEATANLTQVKLGNGGVDLFSKAPCEMILDVIGYYKPVFGAVREGRFIGREPARAVDTRDTIGYVFPSNPLVVDLTAFVPNDASSAVINLTATECVGPSFFTVYPYTSAELPFVSSLNVNAAGETRAAAVIAPVATQPDGHRYIKVFAQNPAKLIVDVTGYFTGTVSAQQDVGLFVPIDPVRILDTREPGTIGKLWPGWFVEGAIPGDGSLIGSAAVVNLTGVEARGPGFLTMSAARNPLPGTSNLNFTYPGQVVPNQVITRITQGFGYQVYSHSGAHIVVDYTGYYTGTPAIARTGAPVNPPPPPIGPTWILRVPKLGLNSEVREGASNPVTNAGHSWHWTGTGYMGQEAHVAAFAHRTSAGGPYRNIHLLGAGDQFTLSTSDGRTYTYEVVDRFLTDSRTQNILDATRFVPGTTFSLIACTEPNFLPTSTAWRIVVTGVLLGWS
ncbi:MAG TPA: sortase [Ilumatobacter sp.]|nr:sortase [Ilumatobacter sp.]